MTMYIAFMVFALWVCVILKCPTSHTGTGGKMPEVSQGVGLRIVMVLLVRQSGRDTASGMQRTRIEGATYL